MTKTARIAGILLLTAAFLTGAFFFAAHHPRKPALYGDSLGYYLYLPSTFIHHSYRFPTEPPPDVAIDPRTRQQLADISARERGPGGHIDNQYTCGVAMMEAPFFLLAHGWEQLTGGAANGFSLSYLLMLRLAGLFYLLAGMFIVHNLLRRYFSPLVAVAVTALLAVGTNIFWFVTMQPGMAHLPLFFLYAALMWLTVRLHEAHVTRYILLTGLTAGLITLIRPTDLVCVLIPLLYGIKDRESLREKLRFLARHRGKMAAAVLTGALPIVPQLLYWKLVSGHWVHYSYGEQGFDWLHPKLIDGLFSAGNGWLAYTPLMLFAIAGIARYRRYRDFALPIVVLLPLYLYITYSWYAWNYPNGFGSRPMIHLYPLLALPLAAVLQDVFGGRRLLLKMGFASMLLLCVYANVKFSQRQAMSYLSSENSNWRFNLYSLFRSGFGYEDLVCMDNGVVQPAPGETVLLRRLARLDYTASTGSAFLTDEVGNRFCSVPEGVEYPPARMEVTYDPALFAGAKWIRCSGRFLCPVYVSGYDVAKMTLGFYRGDKDLAWTSCGINNKIGLAERRQEGVDLFNAAVGVWGTVYCYYPLPAGLRQGDRIVFLVWNPGKRPLMMDELGVELWR